MYCIAERVALPPLKEEERKALLEKAALVSVSEILEAVPDPRKRHGVRYDLAFVLTCLLAALLRNCNSTEAVAQWCREHEQLLREIFGPRLFLRPSGSLYRKLLPRLDVQAVEEVLRRWIGATLQAAAKASTPSSRTNPPCMPISPPILLILMRCVSKPKPGIGAAGAWNIVSFASRRK